MIKKNFIEHRKLSLFYKDVKKEVTTGYTKSFDGTHIWFRKVSPCNKKSFPAIIFANGVGTTIRYWRYVEDYISNLTDVIVWDYRGHGRSLNPASPDVSISALAKDMKAVYDATTEGGAVFGGFSLGVQVILEFFRLFPDKVRGLIPALGPYERPASYFMNLPITETMLKMVSKLVFRNPSLAQKVWSRLMTLSFAFKVGKSVGLISEKLFFLNPLLAYADDFTEYFENLRKMDITVFFKIALEAQNHSAEDILEKINVPTLIIIGENDIFTPMYVQMRMAQRIKSSEVLILPKGSHGGLVEHAELVCLRIEKFLKDHFE